MTYKEFKERLEYLGIKDNTELASFSIKESKYSRFGDTNSKPKTVKVITFEGEVEK